MSKKQVYTREEVIDLIENMFQHADAVMDAVTNENTNYNAEELLEMTEEWIEIHSHDK